MEIFYSCCGVGRGHASRVMTVVRHLTGRGHDVTVFTSGEAYRFLKDQANQIRLKEIPAPVFGYDTKRRVSLLHTSLANLPLIPNYRTILRNLSSEIERKKPDLVITDFEPFLCRSARTRHVPVISLDHQHAFVFGDFHELPFDLKRFCVFTGIFVDQYVEKNVSIVASFFQPRIKRAVNWFGGLVTEDVLRAKTRHDNHILVYIREGIEDRILKVLRNAKETFRIYNCTHESVIKSENFEFKKINRNDFVNDLATCKAVISTAGHQLLTEALCLQKPVFAVPLPGQEEQAVNGYFLEKMGYGRTERIERLTPSHIQHFLTELESFTKNDYNTFCGNEQIFHLLNCFIETAPVPLSS
jgi:uncharacterized protein (TIGR00661 family)